MSRKFLSPVNLPSSIEPPAVATAGDLFFKADELVVYYYNGESWGPVGGGSAGSTDVALVWWLGI